MVWYDSIDYASIDPILSNGSVNSTFSCHTSQRLKDALAMLLQQICDVKVCIGLVIALTVIFLIILIAILVLVYQ